MSIKIEFEDRVFFQDDDLKCAVLSDGKCVSGQPGGRVQARREYFVCSKKNKPGLQQTCWPPVNTKYYHQSRELLHSRSKELLDPKSATLIAKS